MFINRLLLLGIFTLSLVSCANTSMRCINGGGKSLENSYRAIITEEKIDTHEKQTIFEDVALEESTGIKSVNLQNTTIKMELVDKLRFEEYSAPVINKINKKYFKPPSGLTAFMIIMAPITIPLSLVMNSEGVYNETFGCIEQEVIKGKIDLTRKVKTGASEWRETTKVHNFLVSGFDRDYVFDRQVNSITNEINIDLSEAILNTELSNNTTIKVTCLDCDLLGQEEQNIFKDVKKTVELNADFRDIKTQLVAQDKIQKLEQAKRDKEAETNRIKDEKLQQIEQARLEKEAELQRVIKEKENLELKKESLGVPLNDFKNQCKQLGFKEGTKVDPIVDPEIRTID